MKLNVAATVLGSAALAACWGDLGHRTVGYLAQLQLTDAGKQYVNDLIHPTDTFDISDAAVWPDKARRKRGYEYTAGWHFIDAKDDPPQSCSVNYDRDCSSDAGCIVSAISNQTAVIQDSTASDQTRNEALKFLLHFLGDIHQPLHTEAIDRGGNQIKVCFDGKCGERLNLHEVWDTEIPNKINGLTRSPKADEEKAVAQQWAQKLASSSSSINVRAGQLCDSGANAQTCALEYATETNAFVCNYVLKPGLDWLENNDLGDEYYTGAAGIVEDRITKAGQRLALWINTLASGAQKEGMLKQDLKV